LSQNISFHYSLFAMCLFYYWRLKILFASFFQAESAIAALSCSGVILGALPIRFAGFLFDFNCAINFMELL
jgi:hypothetical protein